MESTLLAGVASIASGQDLWYNFKLDFQPRLEFKTEQWPGYDAQIYKSIVWDREYFLTAAVTASFTLELFNQAYYTFEGTFSFFKIGFGV